MSRCIAGKVRIGDGNKQHRRRRVKTIRHLAGTVLGRVRVRAGILTAHIVRGKQVDKEREPNRDLNHNNQQLIQKDKVSIGFLRRGDFLYVTANFNRG